MWVGLDMNSQKDNMNINDTCFIIHFTGHVPGGLLISEHITMLIRCDLVITWGVRQKLVVRWCVDVCILIICDWLSVFIWNTPNYNYSFRTVPLFRKKMLILSLSEISTWNLLNWLVKYRYWKKCKVLAKCCHDHYWHKLTIGKVGDL